MIYGKIDAKMFHLGGDRMSKLRSKPSRESIPSLVGDAQAISARTVLHLVRVRLICAFLVHY